MENHTALTFSLVDHADVRMQRLGFDLADPYVEQCRGPLIGPSTTLLLRRMPAVWAERVSSTIIHEELARSLGLGAGTGSDSRLVRAIDCAIRFGFATWHEQGRLLDVDPRCRG